MASGEAVQLEARSALAANLLTIKKLVVLHWEDATVWW